MTGVWIEQNCTNCARPLPVFNTLVIGAVTEAFCRRECCDDWFASQGLTRPQVLPLKPHQQRS